MNGFPLEDYTTVIRSGLIPAPAGIGQLSAERAARLAEQLRSLQAGRDRALIESQAYWIVPRNGPDAYVSRGVAE